MKFLRLVLALIGLALFVYGIASAVIAGNPIWYSYFTLGFFLFFDFFDEQVNGDSNLFRLVRGEWKPIVYTYLAYVVFAIIIDLVMGRWIIEMWVYPYFNLTDEIIHVIGIGYPLAFFSTSVLYRTLYGCARGLFTSPAYREAYRSHSRARSVIAGILMTGTVLALLVPPLNYFLFNNTANYEVTVLCMIMGSFSMAPLGYFLFPCSFLHDILRPDWRAIGTLLITTAVTAFLHEIPNTYAWEWRYQNIPFTSFELFDVNIIILTVCWFFLTVLGISVNDIFLRKARKKLPQSV